MANSLCPSDISQQPLCSQAEIEHQSKAISDNRKLLDVLVLNQTRQIVFANQVFLNFLGAPSLAEVLGKKPGDALTYEHAVQSARGQVGFTSLPTDGGAAVVVA